MFSLYLTVLSILSIGGNLSHSNQITCPSEIIKLPTKTTKSFQSVDYSYITTAECEPLSEFTQDFNSTAVGEVPDCWNTIKVNSSSSNVDLHVKPNPNAITPPNDFQFSNSTDDNAIFYLVSPELSTLSDGNHRLSFYYNKNGNNNVIVQVGTMENATDENTFTPVTTISPTSGYDQYIVNFDQETTDSHIAFKLSYSIGFSRVYLDNVSWKPILSCIVPTELSFDSSDDTTANLSWTPGADESNWLVSYGEQGFDLETEGEVQEISDMPSITLSNLTTNTQYQAYIKAICDDNEESNYAGPINFYTGYCPGTAVGGTGSIDSFKTTGGYENIDNQNTGSDQGYEDYTDMVVSQSPGNAFNFSAKTTSGTAGFAIYIDYDHDFIFDPTEKVYTSNGYASAVSGTISIPEDIEPGEYRLRVVSNWLSIDPEPCHNGNQGEIEDYTLEVVESSGGNNDIYCIPSASICSDGDVITNVTFQEINNTTECSPDGYGDYTTMTATVGPNNTYPISITVGGGYHSESVSVWIDFNDNGIFDEEEFFSIGTGSDQTLTGDIAIPADVTNGNYRMRVRVAAVTEDLATWNMSCGDVDQLYGETEDYTVTVDETLSIDSYTTLDFKYHPNPMTDVLHITTNEDVKSVSVYNMLGQEVLSNKHFNNGKVDVTSLPNGTYIFRARFDNGHIENFQVLKK